MYIEPQWTKKSHRARAYFKAGDVEVRASANARVDTSSGATLEIDVLDGDTYIGLLQIEMTADEAALLGKMLVNAAALAKVKS